MRATLTERQQEVFEHILTGASNKAIASSLGIAESTVKVHVIQIMRTFKFDTKLELLASVIQMQQAKIETLQRQLEPVYVGSDA